MAGIIDHIDALEIGLPRTDQDKLPDDTREDDHGHDEEEEVLDDEVPFNPQHPPPQRSLCDDQ
jgi:hypothetical protein